MEGSFNKLSHFTVEQKIIEVSDKQTFCSGEGLEEGEMLNPEHCSLSFIKNFANRETIPGWARRKCDRVDCEGSDPDVSLSSEKFVSPEECT